MKKIILGIICFIAISICIKTTKMNSKESITSFNLNLVEAIAQNEAGCINKPGNNDGHCATDGTFYLCENKGSKDCMKGQYPY